MSGRHRADGEPCSTDSHRLLGALAAEPLEHEMTQAITDLTTRWLRGIDPAPIRAAATEPDGLG